MRLPYRILALEDDPQALSSLVQVLRAANYLVTGATTRDAAKRLLAYGSFDLLVTDAHLGTFNGTSLVRHAATAYPDMAVMILAGAEDPSSDLQARRSGVACFTGAVESREFLQAVARCLRAVRRPRRWERRRVDALRVVANGVPATVIDVCYGGLRLEWPELIDVPPFFDVEIPGIGLNLPVEMVWTKRSASGRRARCGVALIDDSGPPARTWRAIVDRLGGVRA